MAPAVLCTSPRDSYARSLIALAVKFEEFSKAGNDDHWCGGHQQAEAGRIIVDAYAHGLFPVDAPASRRIGWHLTNAKQGRWLLDIGLDIFSDLQQLLYPGHSASCGAYAVCCRELAGMILKAAAPIGGPEEPSSPTAGGIQHSVLQIASGLQATAFGRYRDKACVSKPGQGKKNHRYSQSEAATIMRAIAENTNETKIRDRCEAWLTTHDFTAKTPS